MTIHLSIVGIVIWILAIFLFLVLFRWYIILKSVILYTSDLISRCPERYVDLDIEITEDSIKEFVENKEARTLDIELFVIVANSELYLNRVTELCKKYNIKFNSAADIDNSIVTYRFYKTAETESESDSEES